MYEFPFLVGVSSADDDYPLDMNDAAALFLGKKAKTRTCIGY